jgi:hypothetical protein
MAAPAPTFTLVLTEAECAELLRIVNSFLIETHGENRRTENPQYRDELRREESLLRGLVQKIKQLRGGEAVGSSST